MQGDKPLTSDCRDLGVTQGLARPHTPDDTILAQGNPYSEAQFKTVKYHPTFPERFGSMLDARLWGQWFFSWSLW